MGYTNFPNGLTSFGFPVIGGAFLTSGKVLWVNYTTGTDGSDRGVDAQRPLKTLDYAIGLCSADAGDMIILMPGHAESIIAAGTITADIAGVTILGLGTGTKRPTFTFGTATTATIAVSAANVSIYNCIFDYTGVDAIATGINVTGASFLAKDCKYLMANSTNQATVAVTLGTGADSAKLYSSNVLAPNAGAAAWVTSAVAADNVRIEDNLIQGDFSTAPITNATNAWTNCSVARNSIVQANSGAAAISLVSTATGVVRDNVAKGTGWSAATTPFGNSSTLLYAQNFAIDNVTGSAILCPAAGTIS